MKQNVLVLILFLLISCTSNTIYEKPKNLISKDTMAALITDMIIATAAKNRKTIHKKRKINYMPFIYEKYKIDSTRFMESNIYYVSVFEEYQEILEQAKTTLVKQQTFFADSIKKIDSIKAVKLKKNAQYKKLKKKKELNPNDSLLKKISDFFDRKGPHRE